jgi:hypothetical protein
MSNLDKIPPGSRMDHIFNSTPRKPKIGIRVRK